MPISSASSLSCVSSTTSSKTATAATSDDDDYKTNISTSTSSTNNKTCRAKSRKARVYTFYDFLQKTYPSLFRFQPPITTTTKTTTNNDHVDEIQNIHYSRQPEKRKNNVIRNVVVLDVAGGKGHLSWLISNLHHHITSIVIDPRKDDPFCSSLTNNSHNDNHTLPAKKTPPPPTTTITNNYKSILKSISFLEANPDIVQQRNILGTKEYQPLAALLPTLIQRRDERLHFIQTKNQRCHDKSHDSTSLNHNEDMITIMDHAKDCWNFPRRMKIYFDDRLVHAFQEEVRYKCTRKKNMMIEDHHPQLKKKENQHIMHQYSVDDNWKNYWHEANKMNNDKTDIHTNSTEENRNSDDVIHCPEEAWHYLRQTKLIVGFHPDQATEAIVDLALDQEIPFCVVPCCVFPKEFPNRYLPSSYRSIHHGDVQKTTNDDITFDSEKLEKENDESKSDKDKIRVRDYDTFLKYLKCKDERIREANLPFLFSDTARKVVLYMLPEDFE